MWSSVSLSSFLLCSLFDHFLCYLSCKSLSVLLIADISIHQCVTVTVWRGRCLSRDGLCICSLRVFVVFLQDLDSYLKNRSPVKFLSELRSNLQVRLRAGTQIFCDREKLTEFTESMVWNVIHKFCDSRKWAKSMALMFCFVRLFCHLSAHSSKRVTKVPKIATKLPTVHCLVVG